MTNFLIHLFGDEGGKKMKNTSKTANAEVIRLKIKIVPWWKNLFLGGFYGL